MDGGCYVYRLMRGQLDEDLPDEDVVEGPPGRERVRKAGVLDLGHDFMVMFHTRQGSDVKVGLINSHRGPNGEECAGSVRFDLPETADLDGPKWQVHSLDPLHIEPSLLCRMCGNHGFIRNGEWVPA